MFKTFSILFTVKYILYLNTKVSHTHIYPTKKKLFYDCDVAQHSPNTDKRSWV